MRVIRIEQFELIVLKTKPNQSYQKDQPEETLILWRANKKSK